MKNQKKLVYILVGIFILYLISVLLENNFWNNILSSIVAFLSSFIIFKSIKKINNYKSCWILLFFCTFSWGLGDFLWLIYENIIFENPINNNFISIIYTLPNLFLLILVTVYLTRNFRKWNIYQLIIDSISISSILVVLLWSLIFSKTGLEFKANFEYINIIIYIFLNFCIIWGVIMVYVSKKLKNNKSFYMVLAAIIIYIFADYYYGYMYLIKTYKSNTFIEVIYTISNVLFVLGAVYQSNHEIIEENININELPENLRKPKKSVFIFIILFYFLYLINFLSFNAFIIINVIFLLYWLSISHIQTSIHVKYLLKSEYETNNNIERIVSERTKELIVSNEYLQEISNKEPLTNVYNRRYFINYLDSLFDSHMYKSLALLYIDINRFKAINKSYGHEIGDRVLCVLGNRFLENCMTNYKIFHIGGDEFAVLIEDYNSKDYVTSVANKILEIVQEPIVIQSCSLTITASIGIALYPEDTEDKEIFMRYADLAMYEVKKRYCKNNYLFFDSDLSEKAERKQEIEFLLKNADYDKEFVLYYQPQYSTSDDSLIGMEALIRWIHPEKGFISPSEFIPIAEEIGLIIDISEWVIHKAFSQIKKWNEAYELNLKMGVNISPIQIENTDFINWFRKKISDDNVQPDWIDVEITEGSAMNPNLSMEEIFDSLYDMGVSTSIDDFGTGYSSLSYIRKFNITKLKIAKELIDNICEDKNSLLIVQAIIMMARGMGLKTIAEGVEYENQLEILKELGCDEIQGYIFGKPVPSEEFEKEHVNKLVKN